MTDEKAYDDAGEYGETHGVEELATLIAAAFPHPGGGSQLIWEDCFPAAKAIIAAGWRPFPGDPEEFAGLSETDRDTLRQSMYGEHHDPMFPRVCGVVDEIVREHVAGNDRMYRALHQAKDRELRALERQLAAVRALAPTGTRDWHNQGRSGTVGTVDYADLKAALSKGEGESEQG